MRRFATDDGPRGESLRGPLAARVGRGRLGAAGERPGAGADAALKSASDMTAAGSHSARSRGPGTVGGKASAGAAGMRFGLSARPAPCEHRWLCGCADVLADLRRGG